MSKGLENFAETINRKYPEIISIDDVSKITGLRKSFFYNMKGKDKSIPYMWIGKRMMFFKHDLVLWLKDCQDSTKKDSVL
jgi:predicted DNA-binding transcriptional regulator AlpA